MTVATEIKPVIRVLKIDETEHWSEPYRAAAGRIFSVYVYDARSVTRCCEITPSYALHFVESQTEQRVSDEVNDEMLVADCETPPVAYMHCHTVDAVEELSTDDICDPRPTSGMGAYTLFEEQDGDSDEIIEEALEYARSNSV